MTSETQFIGSTSKLQTRLLKGYFVLTERLFRKRGMRSGVRLAAKIFSKDNKVVLPLGNGFRYPIWLNDPYWAMLLRPDYRYEDEIEEVLSRVLSDSVVFIDCGANLGYWSLFACSQNSKQVISVEASPLNQLRLEANIEEICPGKVQLQKAAISSTPGEQVDFLVRTIRHGSCQVVGADEAKELRAAGERVETVRTTTVDELVSTYAVDSAFVLKIDVEGQEIPTMKGAADSLALRPLVIFEDHSEDPEHENSSYFIETLKWPVFGFQEGRVVEVDSLAKVAEIKGERYCGHNFFSCAPESVFLPLLRQSTDP